MSRPRKRSIGGSTGLPSFTHHTNGSTGNHHRWGSFTQVEEGERSRMRQVLGIKPLEHAGYVTRTLGVVMIVLVFFFMVTSFLFSKRPHYSVPGYEPTVYTTDPVMLPSRDELILWQKGSSDPNGVYAQPASFVFDSSSRKSPQVVLILALDPATDLTHLERIIANRRQYAKARGYGVFSMSVDQFKHIYEDSVSHSSRWAMLPVCREAMHAFPNAKYFWYLDQDALILDMSLDIEKDIMAPRKLGPMMLRGIPVVRRLPYVHTYKNNDPKMVEFVFTQDEIGMNSRSFIFKNGDSAKALVDLWQDASFRHHDGFDRSDIDALNHLIQWHPFYLGRTAVIPTRKLAAVPDVTSEHMSAEVATSLQYKDGDAVIVIECQQNVRGCSPFFEPFWKLVEEKTATDQIQSPSTISVHPRFVRSVK